MTLKEEIAELLESFQEKKIITTKKRIESLDKTEYNRLRGREEMCKFIIIELEGLLKPPTPDKNDLSSLIKGDWIVNIGSNSKYLTRGKKYQLTHTHALDGRNWYRTWCGHIKDDRGEKKTIRDNYKLWKVVEG